MPCFLHRRLVFLILALGVIVVPAGEPMASAEMQLQFTAWDKAIRNGLLYSVDWSDDGKELSWTTPSARA